MRWPIALSMFLLAWSGATALAAETFPYVAYVAVERARVHAGPGNAYYATDEVTQGMKVEVFRKVEDWLAIKPPPGSFGWVPAREVELTDKPDVAQIVGEDVVAWIGTRLEKNADHVWQTQLPQGDHVRVLAVKRRAGQEGTETWYRIEPPPGDVRWIRAEDVAREQAGGARFQRAAAVAGSDDADGDATPSVLVKHNEPGKAPDDQPKTAEVQALFTPDAVGTGVVEQAQFVPRKERRETPRSARAAAKSDKPSAFKEVDRNVPASSLSPRVASLDKSLPLDPARLLTSSGSFDDRLANLELQLSLTVSKDANEWRLDPLKAQADELVALGATTLERGRARLVQDKIAQFDALFQRRLEVAGAPRAAGIDQVQETVLPTRPANEPKAPAEGLKLPDGVTYDGAGWLKPVYSAKRIAPPYALVDADGKVLAYVTPAPGLNLNRYVKKPVGIFGQKSYLTEFKASHVSASRIVELTKYQ